mmetsp:Transcript_68934/g.179008  ORF Transcript_68934/g.179008 Transcript_68934/m.179008 type:complete len:215 (+) Transcript_68934:454-1098(+)
MTLSPRSRRKPMLSSAERFVTVTRKASGRTIFIFKVVSVCKFFTMSSRLLFPFTSTMTSCTATCPSFPSLARCSLYTFMQPPSRSCVSITPAVSGSKVTPMAPSFVTVASNVNGGSLSTSLISTSLTSTCSSFFSSNFASFSSSSSAAGGGGGGAAAAPSVRADFCDTICTLCTAPPSSLAQQHIIVTGLWTACACLPAAHGTLSARGTGMKMR